MTKAVYDSTNAVANAGGIVAYVASQAGAGSLSGLSDVSLATLANGESLVYNSTSQKWENAKIAYSNLTGTPTLGTAAAKDTTNAITQNSTDPVESGAVYSALQNLPSGGSALYFTSVACSATTGNFATKSDANITANHVVVSVEYADPSAITSDVTWTTTSGNIKLNGTCASATTCSIVLVEKDN